MAPKTACIIRPGPTVCPGQIAFTLRIPGGGTPLRFTRGTVDERRAMLDPGQIAALLSAGYEVAEATPVAGAIAVAADAARADMSEPAHALAGGQATSSGRARRKAGKQPAEA